MTTTSAGALRFAAAIFVLGLLVVWLVRPIGNPCPELGLLPAGSTSSSAPSFAPPLTRTCTYRTAEGTAVRKRYVPVVDALALVLLAGLAGAAVSLTGRGRRSRERPDSTLRRERPAPQQRAPRTGPRAPRAQLRVDRPSREQAAAPEPPPRSRAGGVSVGDRDEAEREQARRDRDARRRARGG